MGGGRKQGLVPPRRGDLRFHRLRPDPGTIPGGEKRGKKKREEKKEKAFFVEVTLGRHKG